MAVFQPARIVRIVPEPGPQPAQPACGPGSGHDPDMWFPESADSPDAAAARRICRGCEARFQCLQLERRLSAASEDGVVPGIWAGLDARERKRRHPSLADRRLLKYGYQRCATCGSMFNGAGGRECCSAFCSAARAVLDRFAG